MLHQLPSFVSSTSNLAEKNRKEVITAQKIKFSVKDFFSKFDQIRWEL